MEFAGKAAASADKVRGGYYTPAPVARFLAAWVRAAGPKIVEPSCGGGAILRELAALSDRVQGVELIADEAAKSRRFAPVDAESLFAWLATAEAGGWDGVAGNPPYIRFGNWPSQQRDPALARDVIERDDKVDAFYDSIFRNLVSHMMENPATISSAAQLLFVARSLERIGDHATNVAEMVHYAATGKYPAETEGAAGS